jgi:hypothetical protein
METCGTQAPIPDENPAAAKADDFEPLQGSEPQRHDEAEPSSQSSSGTGN